MLKFLKNLRTIESEAINSGSSAAMGTNKISSSNVINMLATLRKSRQNISAQFESENVSISCTIGAFDYKHRTLVLSDIYPLDSAMRAFPGKVINVYFPLHGRTVKMSCTYLDLLIPNEYSILQVSMPRELEFVHSPRIHLGMIANSFKATVKRQNELKLNSFSKIKTVAEV